MVVLVVRAVGVGVGAVEAWGHHEQPHKDGAAPGACTAAVLSRPSATIGKLAGHPTAVVAAARVAAPGAAGGGSSRAAGAPSRRESSTVRARRGTARPAATARRRAPSSRKSAAVRPRPHVTAGESIPELRRGENDDGAEGHPGICEAARPAASRMSRVASAAR